MNLHTPTHRPSRALYPWCLLVSVLCLLANLGTLSAAGSKPPDVIILIPDQLRYQSCSFSDPPAKIPNIDRLAKEGMLFRNFVSSTPVCSAFRASLLTGRYVSSTGVVVNELRLNPNNDTFARVLKASGSRTDMIGKWHLWSHQPPFSCPPVRPNCSSEGIPPKANS